MKSPDPIDVHVGERLRLRRQLSGMSQKTLASGVSLIRVERSRCRDGEGHDEHHAGVGRRGVAIVSALELQAEV